MDTPDQMFAFSTDWTTEQYDRDYWRTYLSGIRVPGVTACRGFMVKRSVKRRFASFRNTLLSLSFGPFPLASFLWHLNARLLYPPSWLLLFSICRQKPRL